MKLDPKVKNLLKFFVSSVVLPLAALFVAIAYFGITDYFRLIGQITIALLAWKAGATFYRRVLLPPKKPLEYGKWAIVTGSTSGIGKDFADYLAKLGMSVLVISRSEEKLKEQTQLISHKFKVPVRYLPYDFTQAGESRTEFYSKLDEALKEMDADGGVGLLINNVGIANEYPKLFEEFSQADIENMIQCNIFSTVQMTRATFKYMQAKKNGCIVSISSGSGNYPAPYLSLYSATKAFMTQFTRSLKIEYWDSGVDFLVVTPFYVVSNLFKRREGTIIAPMPEKLIEGTLAQIGKRYIWEGHGYWFHGFLGNVLPLYPWAVERNLTMMVSNRMRYDEKMAAKSKQQ